MAGSLPYGAVVELGEQGAADTVGGVPGHWRSLVLRGHVGWVFDGFLFEGPVPPEQCASLVDWVGRWEASGPERVNVTRRCDCPDHRIERRRAYRSEWEASFVERYRSQELTLTLPGVSLEQTWLAVRRCLALPDPLPEASVPRSRAVVGDVVGGRTILLDPTEERLRIEVRGEARVVTDLLVDDDGTIVRWMRDEEGS